VDCFPTTLVLGTEDTYPVYTFDIVGACGPTLDGLLATEIDDIATHFGTLAPFHMPVRTQIPDCEIVTSTVPGLGSVGVRMPRDLPPMDEPPVQRETVSLMQQEERWRHSQILAKMSPLVDAIANTASKMTVDGMNRDRYNATTSSVLSELQHVHAQTLFLQSQPMSEPNADAHTSPTGAIRDPNVVHAHSHSHHFRRHLDSADHVRSGSKKQKAAPRDKVQE
jgi:hypothetical protein